MFKVSQDIYLAESDSANHSKTFGVYHQSQQDDSYGDTVRTFVDPCVTQADKVSVLHWPEDNISLNQPVEFVIRKNGARGNVNVKVRPAITQLNDIPLVTADIFTQLVNVKNQSKDLDLVVLDPDRYLCRFTPTELGIQKMRVYFNTVEIPSSPFPFYVRDTPLTE